MRDEQGAYCLADFLLELRSSSAETVDIYLPIHLNLNYSHYLFCSLQLQ